MAALSILGAVAMTLLATMWLNRPTKKANPISVLPIAYGLEGTIRYRTTYEPEGYPEDQGEGPAAAEYRDETHNFSRVSPIAGEASEALPWMATTAPRVSEQMAERGESGSEVIAPPRVYEPHECVAWAYYKGCRNPNHWVLEFETNDLATYAQQLDQWGVEIGVIGNWPSHLDYASALTLDSPYRSRREVSAEQRIFLGWKSARRPEFDSRLLAAAGIPHIGLVVVHFYPRPLARHLRELERSACEEIPEEPGERLERTVFRARRDENGRWELYVAELQFRATKTETTRTVAYAADE